MAIIKLENVIVTYLNKTGGGVKVEEVNESRGKTYKQKYTLWFTEGRSLAVGDHISVSGFLSAKVSEPWKDRDGNDRYSVELSVNNPRLEGGKSKQPDPVAPMDEPWAETTPDYSGSTPF